MQDPDIISVKKIDHPSHYNKGIEAIEVIESHDLNFNRGNIIKYVLRAGHKMEADEIEDLRKANWYINREINRLMNED